MTTQSPTLPISSRSASGKAVVSLRKQGYIPAVMYGSGFPTESIQVLESDFLRVHGKVSSSTILNLDKEGGSCQALMHDWATDPVTGRMLHIDFLRIRADQEIDTEVQLEFTGEAPVVKEQGGVLVMNLNAIEVRCLPAKLPEKITVDLSSLSDFSDSIRVEDIKVPSGVEVLTPADSVAVPVTHVQVETEEVASTETVPESAKEPVAPSEPTKDAKKE